MCLLETLVFSGVMCVFGIMSEATQNRFTGPGPLRILGCNLRTDPLGLF